MSKNFLAFWQAIYWLCAIYGISQFMNSDNSDLSKIASLLAAIASAYYYHFLLMKGKEK